MSPPTKPIGESRPPQAISRAIRLCSHHTAETRTKGVTVRTYVAVTDQNDALGQEAVHILQSLKQLQQTETLLYDVKTRALDAELYGKPAPSAPSSPDLPQHGALAIEGVQVSTAVQTPKPRKKRARPPSPEQQLRTALAAPDFTDYAGARKQLRAILKRKGLADDFKSTGKKWLKFITLPAKDKARYRGKLFAKYPFLAVPPVE